MNAIEINDVAWFKRVARSFIEDFGSCQNRITTLADGFASDAHLRTDLPKNKPTVSFLKASTAYMALRAGKYLPASKGRSATHNLSMEPKGSPSEDYSTSASPLPVSQRDNELGSRTNSAEASQSLTSDLKMYPRILLKRIKIKIGGADVKITPFEKMFPGGVTEAAPDIEATLEDLSIVSGVNAGYRSNRIVLGVTMATYREISKSHTKASLSGNTNTEITFAADSFAPGQFWFGGTSPTDGKWGDMLTFKEEASFVTTRPIGYQRVANGLAFVTFEELHGNNFPVSLCIDDNDSDAKFVIDISRNNSP